MSDLHGGALSLFLSLFITIFFSQGLITSVCRTVSRVARKTSPLVLMKTFLASDLKEGKKIPKRVFQDKLTKINSSTENIERILMCNISLLVWFIGFGLVILYSKNFLHQYVPDGNNLKTLSFWFFSFIFCYGFRPIWIMVQKHQSENGVTPYHSITKNPLTTSRYHANFIFCVIISLLVGANLFLFEFFEIMESKILQITLVTLQVLVFFALSLDKKLILIPTRLYTVSIFEKTDKVRFLNHDALLNEHLDSELKSFRICFCVSSFLSITLYLILAHQHMVVNDEALVVYMFLVPFLIVGYATLRILMLAKNGNFLIVFNTLLRA